MSERREPKATEQQGHSSAPEQAAMPVRVAIAGLAGFVVITVLLAGGGMLKRHHADEVLAERTSELAPPTVIAKPARPGSPVNDFTLPGNTTAYTDSPIYARTAGYLKRWYFDIGARVRKGALLAEIETPEVDQELVQAEADLNTAQANANNARIQAERYKGLVQSNAVSQQDTDTFVNQAASTSAQVRSAQANVQRLQALKSFEKVYAPFDGVVTARDVDTGQLIDPGAGKEMFHMQAIQTLRVYTNVPQLNAPEMKRGQKIALTFQEYPGKTFMGTLVRTADAIDPASRTLLVELDVNNAKGELLPGALAQVHFKTPTEGPSMIIPVAALIFRREGLQVGTVVNGDTVHLVQVVVGVDDGANVQIISGLGASDKVIQDPPDSIIEGEKVTVVNPSNHGEAGDK